MSAEDTIKVPARRPPSWAPAWREKPPAAQLPRTLDLADWLYASGLALAGADVFVDPTISVAGPHVVTDSAVTIHVAGGQPGTKVPIRFVLHLAGGDVDEIVAWLPIGRAAPEVGVMST